MADPPIPHGGGIVEYVIIEDEHRGQQPDPGGMARSVIGDLE